MAGRAIGKRIARAFAGVLALGAFVPVAAAVEVLDGRVQAHGFGEIQGRALSRDYAEEIDLSQWYWVFNVEIEADLLPDGWGPFDLLQTYIRAEGRYDCIYSGGCGLLPSKVNTYGNSSQNLPLRLRDATDEDYGGVIDTNVRADPPGLIPRINPKTRDPVGWAETEVVPNELGPATDPTKYTPNLGFASPDRCPVNDLPDSSADLPGDPGCIDNRIVKTEVRKREGFPGFDTLFDSEGADGELGDQPDFVALGTAFRAPSLVPASTISGSLRGDFARHFRALADIRDDPGFYTLGPVIDWKFAHREFPGVPSGGTGLPMGPWLPNNRFNTLAALSDRANPLRGRDVPVLVNVDGTTVRDVGVRLIGLECDVDSMGMPIGPLNPDCPGTYDPTTMAVPDGVDPVDPRLRQLEDLSVRLTGLGISTVNVVGGLPGPRGAGRQGRFPNNEFFQGVRGDRLYGGDFSGIIPCFDTVPEVGDLGNAASRRAGPTSDFVNQLWGSGSRAQQGCIPFTNVLVSGGFGELPMRAAPDFSNLASMVGGGFVAQGLFIPSRGLLDYAAAGRDFDSHEFNIREIDRAFNRGASQRDTYELKEAYFDAEFLDSRLWIRAGIQNIVWGKTELFRTTDQFNPQDLALATLPALEESRIGLLSWRAVYSLYDVGPLEDVRFELAMNFDRFKPADLGACGEPYTPDIVCGLTLGTAIHGVTGIGVAAVDRPDQGYRDVDGLEFGGRIEFRWDRFSFALIDFYGYNDFPYPDPIFFYERNVDPSTGMPRKANARGTCQNRAGFVATLDRGFGAETLLLHGGNAAREAMAVPGSAEAFATRPTGLTDNFNPESTQDDWWRRKEAVSLLGVGHDADCLKPGGAPGRQAENRYDALLAPDDAGFTYSGGAGTITPGVTDALTPGTYVAATVGGGGSIQWTKVGSSVDYALAYHPANQQLFNFICSATVSIAVALAAEACAWNLWGSDAAPLGAAFSEVVSTLFAGDKHGIYSLAYLRQTIDKTKGNTAMFQPTLANYPMATLNSDVRDGRSGAVATDLHYPQEVFTGPRATNDLGDLRLVDEPRDFYDLLTLDQSLTWQQRALLGCGPAYGTRCDSGAAAVRVRIKACAPGRRCEGLPVPGQDALFIGAVDIRSESAARAFDQRYDIIRADGTICPPDDLDDCRIWNRGGGIDFLNAEASVVLQSFVGFEGTEGRTRTDLDVDTWVTWAKDTPQPGTTGLAGLEGFGAGTDRAAEPYRGGVVCSRYAPDSPYADSTGLVTLPGCRGAISATVNDTRKVIEVAFDAHYTPSVDGCVFGRSMTNQAGDTFFVNAGRLDASGSFVADPALQQEMFETCFNRGDAFVAADGNAASPVPLAGNIHQGDPTWFSYSRRPILGGGLLASEPLLGAQTVFHPLAQCEQAGDTAGGAAVWTPDAILNQTRVLCQTLIRDYQNDFLQGNAQVFRNELAAVSFNFGMYLAISSCNSVSGGDDLAEQECFDKDRPWATGRCSLSAPQFCRNVKGFLGVGGLSRNDPRAGGNASFGRRDFIWHSGGELALRYNRRNVFGFSADFAEDRTKTNWGVEFTWIGNVLWGDNNSLTNTTESDAFNLTVSIDRPTFINFLNANRTFFFNTQWFFNYIPKHNDGFSTFGHPFNVLFTFAVFTGYYQDRLLPQIITVYDFGSRTAGFLPQVGYRFTEALSVTFGVSFFVGRSEFRPMPVRGFAPDQNRAGPNAYQDGVLRLITNVSRRDEAWMKLRWTF